MLAKARSDSLARRAALSAPAGFLSRLLLCSGLPRASLLTMIDRLGRLGDAAENKDSVYEKLLAPSAESEWDVGRMGHRLEISRKLLGRLSAYLRLHAVSSNGENSNISTTFLVWLTEDCKSNHDKKRHQVKFKKSKAAANTFLSCMSSASSTLARIANDAMPSVSEVDADVAGTEMDELKHCEDPSLPILLFDLAGDAARNFIATCIQNNRFNLLDEWLEGLVLKQNMEAFGSQAADRSLSTELAIDLLKVYQSLSHAQNGASKMVLKWVPRISRSTGTPELWELIFHISSDVPTSMVSISLLSKCLSSWTMLHVSQCKDWIIALGNGNTPCYDYQNIALFLISTSEQPSAPLELFSEAPSVPIQSDWAISKDFVVSATSIAIRSLRQSRELPESPLCRRNGLPSGVTLLFLVARCGKKQLRSVGDLILQELSAPDTEDSMRLNLEIVFLRLYLCFPHWMDLGSAAARNALMSASERQAHNWVDWRSSFDDKIDDMLDALGSGELRVTKTLVHLSRKQPLLVLRKLPKISALLYADATILIDDRRERRGVITGQNLSENRQVKFHGKDGVTLLIQHWGYSYLEPLWVALLDVLTTIPHEVLFSCGIKVGLLDFLEVYLELLSVQLQLLSAHKASRLKGQLGDVFATFRKCNSKGWKEWLGSKIGDSEVRYLLVSCDFISTQEAMESFKNEERL